MGKGAGEGFVIGYSGTPLNSVRVCALLGSSALQERTVLLGKTTKNHYSDPCLAHDTTQFSRPSPFEL